MMETNETPLAEGHVAAATQPDGRIGAAVALDTPERPTPTAAEKRAAREAQLARQRHDRDKRREEVAKWRPNRSSAFLTNHLELKTEQAQRVYYLGLVHAQRSLFMFYNNLPQDAEAIRTAEKVVEDQFEAIEKSLSDELARWELIAKTAGVQAVSGYSAPLKLEVAMYTFEAQRFANLITNYDRLMQLLDALLFGGELKRQARSNVMSQYRNAIVKFSRRIHLLYQQSRGAVRRALRESERAKTAGSTEGAGALEAEDMAEIEDARDEDAITKDLSDDGEAADADADDESAAKPKRTRTRKVASA